MPQRRCVACGRLTTRPRCADCQRTLKAKYRGDWPKLRAERLAAHRARYGDTCPGWRTDPHPATDLTLDHHVGILCRACNSRKQASGHG